MFHFHLLKLDALGESRPPPRQLITLILLYADLQNMWEGGKIFAKCRQNYKHIEYKI